MFNFLRTKLRAWLGIEAADRRSVYCVAYLGISTDNPPLGDVPVMDQLRNLNTAIVDQGKSFQKQVQGILSTDGKHLSSGQISWQPTTLGGALAELREGISLTQQHIGMVDSRGILTVYMQIEHLANRVKALEPTDLDNSKRCPTNGTPKPRAKAKKGR